MTAVIAFSVFIALIALWIAVALWRPRATVELVHGSLEVRMHGLDILLSLRRHVAIPQSAVLSVRAASAVDVPRTRAGFTGTSFPGLARAGTFGSGSRREFWNVGHAREYLVVEVAPGQRFRRLVIEVDNPHAQAAFVRTRLDI